MAIQHKDLLNADAHEPKHITDATTAQAGHIITPSATVNGQSVLRPIVLADVSDAEAQILANPLLHPQSFYDQFQGSPLNEQTFDTNYALVTFPLTLSEITSSDPLGAYFDPPTAKIVPRALNDVFLVRLDFQVISFTGTPKFLDVLVNASGTIPPTGLNEYENFRSIDKTSTPFHLSQTFLLRATSDFVANGSQIFLRVDAGTITVQDRRIIITDLVSGQQV